MRFVSCLLIGLMVTLVTKSPGGEAKSVKPRVIQVGVAVSPSFKTISGWKSKFTKRLKYASKIFNSEFKIQFKAVAFWDWDTRGKEGDTYLLLSHLREQFPLHGVDIVIGLTRLDKLPDLDQIKDLEAIGRARPFSGYLVIRYPNDPLFKIQEETVMAHELGHLFGAIHTDDRDSIMAPLVDRQIPTRFDHTNRDIIMLTRGLDFRKGVRVLDKRTSQQLLGSYLKLVVHNQPFEFYYALGVFYINLGKNEDAVEAWEQAAILDPKNSQVHLDLGTIYFKLGNYPKAIKELGKAVSGFHRPSERSKKADALNILGQTYLKDGSLLPAHNALSRAAAIQPDNLDIRLNLAIVRLKRGQKKSALKEFEELLEEDPGNTKILGFLGRAYFELGRHRQAISYLKRALKVVSRGGDSPSARSAMAEIYHNLGAVYFQIDRWEEAVNYYRQACGIEDSVECHHRLGEIYFKRGKWDDAIRELAIALQSRKNDPDLYGYLGVALSNTGQSDRALTIFREGLRHVSDQTEASRLHNNIGYLLLQSHHPDLAEREFRLAVSKNWYSVDAHVGLGMAYVRKNNLAAARESLKTAVRLDPKNARARSLLSSVETTIKNTYAT